MIDQVCSMALTIAHHTGRERFSWDDLVEAMTTIESGTAIGIEYIQKETEAVAIHEAGHAVAGHVFMEGAESTRLSIRMRGGSLGHHQALDKEERFSRFRSEEMARLVWTLGAMAAERVFYGENSSGVGGDVMSATTQAAFMVGASAMGPESVPVVALDDENEDEARERVMKRFEKIGMQIMNRTGTGGGPFEQNPIGGVLSDPSKKAMAAQILGQAYVQAYNLVQREPRRGQGDRRRADRAEGDLRRRPGRAPRPAEAQEARRRLRERGVMAEGVTEPTQEERDSLIRRPREEVRVHRLRFAIAYLVARRARGHRRRRDGPRDGRLAEGVERSLVGVAARGDRSGSPEGDRRLRRDALHAPERLAARPRLRQRAVDQDGRDGRARSAGSLSAATRRRARRTRSSRRPTR